MKKILIVTSEYGSGHKTPAEALKQECIQQGHVAEFFDFKDIVGAFTERVTKEFHDFATTHIPLLHRGLAAATDSNTILDVIIALTPAKVSENLEARVREMKPDIIVATFPAANRLIIELKSKYHFQFVCIVTDLKSLHAYWIAPHTDAYIVALPETKTALEALGAPKNKIEVLGYPLRSAFFEEKDTEQIRKKLSIPPNAFVALYMTHSAPDAFAETLAKKMDSARGITPIIICGKYTQLKKTLTKSLRNAHVLGYVNNMDEYLSVANVAIGKAGTGFLLEAASVGCPVIITKYLKPQEDGNATLFASRGFGYIETTATRAMGRILSIQNESTTTRATRATAMRALMPSRSTSSIVRFITSL